MPKLTLFAIPAPMAYIPYYWLKSGRILLMLFAFSKSERSRSPTRTIETTPKTGSGGIEMKKELFAELLSSVRKGGAILRGRKKAGRVFDLSDPDVKAIREQFNLSQEKFAQLLGISVATLRNWEQKRRKPEGAARVLLCVAARYPEAVLNTINAA